MVTRNHVKDRALAPSSISDHVGATDRCHGSPLGMWLCAIAIGLSGCAASTGSVDLVNGSRQWREGQVIDVATGLPVGGASVIAKYVRDSMAPAHSTSICSRLEYRLTGDDGRYRFAINGDGLPIVQAFKAGFRPAPIPMDVDERPETADGHLITRYYVMRRPQTGGQWTDVGSFSTRAEADRIAGTDNQYLIAASGSRAERFSGAWDYLGDSGCIQGGDSRKNAVPYLMAIEAEIRLLADTPQDRKLLESLGRLIESTKTAR
jgi:hypothetical protein